MNIEVNIETKEKTGFELKKANHVKAWGAKREVCR